MEIKLEIPVYNRDSGLRFHWEYGSEIIVKEVNGEMTLSTNKAGLASLAIQLLTLAQDTVPLNSHFHLDEYNGLNEGSMQLVIQKV